MKKKSLVALLLAGAMVLSLAACGSGSSSSGTTVLKVAFNQSSANPEYATLESLSEALEKATDGRYKLEIFPDATLGSQEETLAQVQGGTLDMALVANSIIEGACPDFGIIGTPYVYDSIEHSQRLFESGKLDDLFASAKDAGFTVLCAYNLGSRNVYATKAVTSPSDLKGMKIRVMSSDTMVQMMNYMGGIGTPMAQGDVYSAIQTGTLDGAENNIITYVDLLQYEVAKEYSLTGHLMIPDELIISNKVLESMSAEDQEALKKVCQESIATSFEKCGALRDEKFDVAQNEHGVTVHEVDIAPFQENCKPLIDEVANRSDLAKAAYDAILSER